VKQSNVPGFTQALVSELPWRASNFANGVSVKDLAVTAGWEMQLVRFEPGARFPWHTHHGPEFVYVLEGELIQAGTRLGPGWASIAHPGSVDEDVHSDTGCIPSSLIRSELPGSPGRCGSSAYPEA
jgi:anti-sigma factor ChrR (cupin superfamily)